jgi:hypothetical protein
MRLPILKTAIATAILAGTVVARDAAAVEAAAGDASPLAAEYTWNLATTSGKLRSSGVFLTWDRHGKELFVVDEGVVRVFGPSGMESYSFGDDARLGGVHAVAALEDGDLLLLSSFGEELAVVRSNFRGEPLGKLELKGIPAEVAQDFHPDGIAYAAGKVFIVDRRSMRLVVTDLEGSLVAYRDLAELVGVADKRENNGIRGFGVDAAGNVLFTVQPLFRAFMVTADGRVEGFGTKGSGAGKFNVVGPIAADEQGNLYVGDLLRSVVIVFDKEFRFVREIGSRGDKPGEFFVPGELAVGDGKVFVSQYAGRGVSVYRVAAR